MPLSASTPVRCEECEAELDSELMAWRDMDECKEVREYGDPLIWWFDDWNELDEHRQRRARERAREENLERKTRAVDERVAEFAEARARSALRAWHRYVQHARPSAVARISNSVELAITVTKLIEREVTARVRQVGLSLADKIKAVCPQSEVRDAADRLCSQRNMIAHNVGVNELTDRDAFVRDFEHVIEGVRLTDVTEPEVP